MHNYPSEHSIRLGFDAEIDAEKIGKYNLTDRILSHFEHDNGWVGTNSQHSGESHRVQAYIKRIPFYTDMPRASDKDVYLGICDKLLTTKRAKENPINVTIINTKSDSFFASSVDSTTIKISASANYPLLSLVAPNIDFGATITLYKNLASKAIDMDISGWHNKFPAYELVVGNKILYKYNPADYGFTGPSIVNLNESKTFAVRQWIRLSDWQVQQLSK